MELDKLTTSDRIIAVSGIALFVASFLPWFRYSTILFTVTRDGWDIGFFWGVVPTLLGLASAGIVLGTKLGTLKMPEMSIGTGQAMFIAGAVAAALVVLKLLIGEDYADRAWGLFIAAIAALGLAAGGFMAYQDEQSGVGSS